MRSEPLTLAHPAPRPGRPFRRFPDRAPQPPARIELLPGLEERLPTLAAAWETGPAEEAAAAAGREARRVGHLDADGLAAVASLVFRRLERLGRNAPDDVARLSRAAFACADAYEATRILQKLDGISFSTATLILHFCWRDGCPVLDGPTLSCFGRERPTHVTPEFWRTFDAAMRALDARSGLGLVGLQRALWQQGARGVVGVVGDRPARPV
jgi:hypothetical protein